MTEAFAVVLEEFRNVTLKDSIVLESMGRQVHGVTGGQMREFAQRLRDAAPRTLTVDQILAWADSHQERTGKWPDVTAGIVYDSPDETWRGVDSALRRGLRGIEGDSSLAQLLSECRDFRNKLDLTALTEDVILTGLTHITHVPVNGLDLNSE